ncbi:MAG: cytochrome c [Bacteroidetes bacterium]|nr:cytochrome c [Bacteroidota bacterium]
MKKLLIPAVLIIVMVFSNCSSSKKSASPAYSGPVTVTYDANVLPIIQSHCAPCHTNGKGMRAALNEYDVAKGRIDNIIHRISLQQGQMGFMPKKHDRLPDSLIQVFVDWKAQGVVEKK